LPLGEEGGVFISGFEGKKGNATVFVRASVERGGERRASACRKEKTGEQGGEGIGVTDREKKKRRFQPAAGKKKKGRSVLGPTLIMTRM